MNLFLFYNLISSADLNSDIEGGNQQTMEFAAKITGTGSAFPERRMTNDDIARELTKFGLETNDQWIRERTGIVERRISNVENEAELNSSLGAQAAQRALEMAKGEWVLSIDADEALTPELQDEIRALLRQDPPEIAFRLPWAVTTFGKRLDYGRSARAPLRLFRRQGARFSNDQVHEKVILPPGKIGRLSGRLLHYTHRDFGHYLNKNAKYAWLGAQKRYQAGKKGQGLAGAVFRAFWVFIQIYFIRRGFMDGRVGFLVAVLYSQGAFNKYAGLWTLRREKLMEKK